MDGLEEKIERLRIYIRNASLLKSLVCYLCIASVGVLVLYLLTHNLCLTWLSVIQQRKDVGYYPMEVPVDLTGKWVDLSKNKQDIQREVVLFLYNNSMYVYLLAAFVITGKLFIERKIHPACQAMAELLNGLNAGDYSCELTYQSQDEMGMLCRDAEQLRKTLVREKKRQWELQEEQRKINAAFAHDMRTPLTVIQGYTEFLQKYVPKGKVSQELLMQKLETIHAQEERLLRFSNTMTTIQTMEKWEVACRWIPIREMNRQIEQVCCGMSQVSGKHISCLCLDIQRKGAERTELFADLALIVEVLENLLNNALRYAKSQVWIQAALTEEQWILYVKDDGKGFSQRALQHASDAYFSEEDSSKEHFGIGLSICKLLCESHNGSLTCQNSIEGGAIAAAAFQVGSR